MQVSVAYSSSNGEQSWIELNLPSETTAFQAIEASGLLVRFPEIDLNSQKLGIYGKLVKPEQTLQEYDRVEIYRAIIADPKQVPRRQMADDED